MTTRGWAGTSVVLIYYHVITAMITISQRRIKGHCERGPYCLCETRRFTSGKTTGQTVWETKRYSTTHNIRTIYFDKSGTFVFYNLPRNCLEFAFKICARPCTVTLRFAEMSSSAAGKLGSGYRALVFGRPRRGAS